MNIIQFNKIPKNREEWNKVLCSIENEIYSYIESDEIKKLIDELRSKLLSTNIGGFDVIAINNDSVSGHLNTNYGWIYIQFKLPKFELSHIYGLHLSDLTHALRFTDFFNKCNIIRESYLNIDNKIENKIMQAIRERLIDVSSDNAMSEQPWDVVRSWIDPYECVSHAWLKNTERLTLACLQSHEIVNEYSVFINMVIKYVSNNYRTIQQKVMCRQHQDILTDMEKIIERAVAQGVDESKIRDMIDIAIIKTIQES